MGQIQVFLACSLDGFIAGPKDELDWLEGFSEETAEDSFTPFFAGVGAMLMGRRTFDVVQGMEAAWPYGETPILVATSRDLPGERRATVEPVAGSIQDMIAVARARAGERNVYLDGGRLVRSGLAAGLVDTLTITMIPRILGEGIPLFAGGEPATLELLGARELGAGMVELRYRPKRP